MKPQLHIEDKRAHLITPLTDEVLLMLPQLEGRRTWLKNGGPAGTRVLQFEATSHNMTVVRQLPGLEPPRPGKPALIIPPPASYTSLTEPYPHQTRCLDKMRAHRTFGIFAEQGTGKTKIILDHAGELHATGKITGVLVITKKGVHRQWVDSEIPMHLGVKHWLGTFWRGRPIFSELLQVDKALKFWTINFDALRSEAAIDSVLQFAHAHAGKLLLVLDESQEVKNAQSQRHKNCAEVTHQLAPYRIISTGTPIAKDLTDQWAQFKLLNEDIIGIRYITTFRREFCIMGGFEGRQVMGHRNIEEFKRRTEPYMFRITKREIGMLPKQYNIWKFDLTAEQLRMLRTLKTDLEAQLAGGLKITAANSISVLTKFQQVSNGFIVDTKDEGKAHRLMPVERNPRAIAMLEWLQANEGKAILWMRYKEDVRIVTETLRREHVSFVEYHGDINDRAREEAKRSFCDPAGAQVLVANPAAAGTGLNLQYGGCRRHLYYSNSFNSLERWQSEDRTDRLGADGNVYTDLEAVGSIDGYIRRNLKKKKSLSAMVLDDVRQLLLEVG